MLSLFIEEIHQLEDSGFTVCVDGTENLKIYATLSVVTCDNLALNQMLGFIECFSADFCCISCYATKAQMQTTFFEGGFNLRTREKYDQDIADLHAAPTLLHVNGIKKNVFSTQLTFM